MNVVLFLILSSSVCICSKKDWENLVDRIDLLITDSFLIIQCNEHEIQVIRRVTTFEEFESNLKCTNKENIVSHGIERVQIIDFSKVIISCKNNEIVHLEGNFKRVKASLSKKENQVDWPFVHTPFTKDIQIIDPNQMKFFSEKQIDLTLTEINIDQLPQVKNNLFIYLDFVNRPMICRIRINGLHKKLKNEKCDAHILDEVNEPVCYYKVRLI
jgi:tRNA A37 threonylcarbamoyladenosine dehydratase